MKKRAADAKKNEAGVIDLTDSLDESRAKINMSRLSEFQYYQDGEKINNLAEYNYKRRNMLYEWEIPIPEDTEISQQ